VSDLTGRASAEGRVVDEDSGYSVWALRKAVMTEAGIRPRSLTVIPFWLAQERTSALLGEPADRVGVSCFGSPTSALASVSVPDTAVRAFLVTDGLLFAGLGFSTDCLA